ncbi:glycosyltransferase family 4 protein [Lichenihabitans psoromatis]|uniref:glycosyltransferase family 4 protein n=1 Tax=Lichenihabitans psoromatis TaxID=2528642 RepID=UPI0010383E0B|nr:glycosyltransferase family 1 protein [Lichenihabitans psoromatis]
MAAYIDPLSVRDAVRPASDHRCFAEPETSASGFAINGRFFSQSVTGVQRYAREITGAIDSNLIAQKRIGTLVVPPAAKTVPKFGAIVTRQIGRLNGHAWEQFSLPVSCQTPLLNLCNTAPAIKHRQVVCIHDANVFIKPKAYGRAFVLVYQTLLPMLARRSATITTVSKSSAEQLAEHLPIRLGSIEVLPNGHEHVLRWDKANSRLFQDAPPRRPFVLLLGSQAEHKNSALLMSMAEDLDRLKVDLFVAGGQSRIFTAIEAGCASNIRRLGFVSDDDLALLLENALCLAFPSFTEGFGLPILEAMALGCPVVSSDRASMPEVCGGAALMASPDDREQWVRHIRDLTMSSNLRSDLAARGREQAQRFSWAKSAGGYLDLFGEHS